MQFDHLHIGARDWHHPAWEGAFYPEDLPEEWRLDFYSNTFNVVLVPEEQWLAWQQDDIEECVEEIGEGFYCYFEVHENMDALKRAKLTEINDQLASMAAGIVMFSESDSIQTEYVGLPVTLVAKSQQLEGWSWSHQDRICSGAVCGVLTDLPEDGKAQVSLIKAFMQTLPADMEGAPFFVTEENVVPSKLVSLKTVTELLGY